jgi:hypothetical protein
MHVRGREDVGNCCLVYLADSDLGPILRTLVSGGTPEALAARRSVVFWLTDSTISAIVIIILPPPENRSSAIGC